jgi:hypothetical protein
VSCAEQVAIIYCISLNFSILIIEISTWNNACGG